MVVNCKYPMIKASHTELCAVYILLKRSVRMSIDVWVQNRLSSSRTCDFAIKVKPVQGNNQRNSMHGVVLNMGSFHADMTFNVYAASCPDRVSS